MSFLGGPECSTAGNPLTQFTKHVQDDKSLQRDRMAGRGPGGHFESMRTQQPNGQQDNAMKEFLQQQPGMPHQPFAMEQMRHSLPGFPAQEQQRRAGSPGWAAEFNPGEQARMEAAFNKPAAFKPGFSAGEFQRFQQTNRSSSISPVQQSGGMQGFQRPMYGGGMGMMSPMYQPSMHMNAGIDTSQAKGKGKVAEVEDKNWDEQFAEIDAEGKVKDVNAEANAAMEAELNELDRSVEHSEETLGGDFESIWKGIQAEREANRQIVDDQHAGQDFDIANGVGEYDPWEGFEDIGTHADLRDPQLGEYLFEDDNIFRNVSNPFDEGMKIMREGGNLSLAALAFEAAVQKDPNHVEAWNMLGSAQAQNEKETPAIRALERALELDGNNLEALMGLAVSYTNEGYDATAYRTLERWLSVKYPQIIDPSDLSRPADVGFTDRHQLHEKVTDLFIKAAQLSPDGEAMDPDVQVGLGVLFYGHEAYDKAVDCFSAALASTATDGAHSTSDTQVHLLWNRLGATLANSGRPEEAIAAYERALELNPNFVRARYNLGVSCINIGCFDQAAQHLLGALAMHAVVRREGAAKVREVLGGDGAAGLPPGDDELERMINSADAMNQSSNLYETLRRVFGQMDRRDLAEMVVPGMDVEVFRKHFDF